MQTRLTAGLYFGAMAHILLAGKDWQARALLRAQLIEEGLEVEAHESVADAAASLESQTPPPELLLADISMSDDPAGDVETLAARTKRVPIWVIASPSLIAQGILKGRGFEMILFRPVDVGELVEQIKRRTEG